MCPHERGANRSQATSDVSLDFFHLPICGSFSFNITRGQLLHTAHWHSSQPHEKASLSLRRCWLSRCLLSASRACTQISVRGHKCLAA